MHHFREVWDDESIIPSLEMRFDLEGTDLRGLTLQEVLLWAHQRFVERRVPRAALEYPLPAAQRYAVLREE